MGRGENFFYYPENGGDDDRYQWPGVERRALEFHVRYTCSVCTSSLSVLPLELKY